MKQISNFLVKPKDSQHQKAVFHIVESNTYPDLSSDQPNTIPNYIKNLTKIYFDFMYYLCCSPVRFVQDPSTNQYVAKSWLPQKILVALINILSLFLYVVYIRDTIPKNSADLSKHAGLHFDLMSGLAMLIYKVFQMKVFWFDSDAQLDLLNWNMEYELRPPDNLAWVTKPITIYTIYGLATFHAFFCFISGYGIISPISSWTPSIWFAGELANAKRMFFITSNLNSKNAPYTTTEIVLGLTGILTLSRRRIIGIFPDLWLLMSAFAHWIAAKSFAQDIKSVVENANMPWSIVRTNKAENKDYGDTWPRLFNGFIEIQNLSLKINTALGGLVFWYLAEALISYATKLNAVIIVQDWYVRTILGSFLAILFTFILVAADIPYQLSNIEVILAQRKNVPLEELGYVYYQLVTNGIGMKGYNMFTVTYSFVAAYMTLIVTIFIICVQNDSKEEY